jgi:hypothetical protein
MDGFNFWQVPRSPGDVDEEEDSDNEGDFGTFADAVMGESSAPAPVRQISLGEAAAAAAQGKPLPNGQCVIVAGSPRSPASITSPQGALRRFGTEGPGPVFGQRERNERRHRAQTEMAAFQGAVDEICKFVTATPSRLSLAPVEQENARRNSLSTVEQFRGWCKSFECLWELIELECIDDFDEWTDQFQEAVDQYKGKRYTTEQMLELPPKERIGLVSVPYMRDGEPVVETVVDDETGEETEEPRVCCWMDPLHGCDDGGCYQLRADAYGSYLNVRNLLESLEHDIEVGQGHNKALLEITNPIFIQLLPGALRSALGDATRDTVVTKLREYVNPPANALPQVVEAANRVRTVILRRQQHFMSACTMRGKLEKLVSEKRARRMQERQDGVETILDLFGDVDAWSPIICFLDAPAAACMLRVIIGAADRVNGKLAPDPEVVDLIKGRYPHLHIYEVMGSFPHTREGPYGVVYANHYAELSIGVVTSKLRTTLRKERKASGYVPPLSDEEKKVDDGKVKAGANREFLMEERHSKLVADDYDFGYDADEEKVRTINAAVLAQQKVSTGPKRRVKNDGWAVQESVINSEVQYQTFSIDGANSPFRESPKLTLKVVNAETGEVVESSAEHGGLEPDQWLRAGVGIFLHTAPPVRVHVPRNEDQEILTLKGNVGTLVRVKSTVLSSRNQSAKFKVVIEASARTRRSNLPVVMRAESKPMIFVSRQNVKKAEIGYGRKRKMDGQ